MSLNDLKKGWGVELKSYPNSSMTELVGITNITESCNKKFPKSGINSNSFFPNLGKNGENLSVAVLSLNRSNLTIKLLQSIENQIPDFRGSILIGDNGSTENEIANLREFIKVSRLRLN